MKLYRVTVKMTFLVAAKTPAEAQSYARQTTREGMADGERRAAEVCASEVESLTEDEARCLPWGGDGDLTCGQYLAAVARGGLK